MTRRGARVRPARVPPDGVRGTAPTTQIRRWTRRGARRAPLGTQCYFATLNVYCVVVL